MKWWVNIQLSAQLCTLHVPTPCNFYSGMGYVNLAKNFSFVGNKGEKKLFKKHYRLLQTGDHIQVLQGSRLARNYLLLLLPGSFHPKCLSRFDTCLFRQLFCHLQRFRYDWARTVIWHPTQIRSPLPAFSEGNKGNHIPSFTMSEVSGCK